MENKFYHGLAGGIPFWEEDKILDESLRVLNLIFKYKAIYCRTILNQYDIYIFENKIPVYNGNDYISICMSNPPVDDWKQLGNEGLESSFWVYAKQKIAIEFKPSIEQECIFREHPYRHLPGERQVYQSIDISQFSRILIGFEDEKIKNTAIEELTKICEPFDIPVMTFKDAELEDKQQKRLCIK